VRLVVADTGPVNYLLLIGEIALLPALFEKVTLPEEVRRELASSEAPAVVRDWLTALPGWVELHASRAASELFPGLGPGESAAIELGVRLRADLLLMDDRRGVKAATDLGLQVTGTLGILSTAADRGLVDLKQAFDRLKKTNFRYSQQLLDDLLRS
jgi:predicted nucleic acid-binding protein